MNLSLPLSISWGSSHQEPCCQRLPSSFHGLQTLWLALFHVLAPTSGLAPLSWSDDMNHLLSPVLRTPHLCTAVPRQTPHKASRIFATTLGIPGRLFVLPTTSLQVCSPAFPGIYLFFSLPKKFCRSWHLSRAICFLL